MLGVSEREVLDLADSGSLPAYKIGGVYLRFKREQVEDFKKRLHAKTPAVRKHSLKDGVSDFIYFNDFYIFSFVVILLMLFIIFKS